MSIPWKNSPVKAGFPSDRRLDLQGSGSTNGSVAATPSSNRGDRSVISDNSMSSERANVPSSGRSATSTVVSGGNNLNDTVAVNDPVAPQRLFTTTPTPLRPSALADGATNGNGNSTPHTMNALLNAMTPASTQSSSHLSSGHTGSSRSSSHKKEAKRSSPNGSIIYKGESGGGTLRSVPLREDRAVYSMLLSSACSSMFDDDDDHEHSVSGPDSPRIIVPAQVRFFLDDQPVLKSSPSLAGGSSKQCSPEGSNGSTGGRSPSDFIERGSLQNSIRQYNNIYVSTDVIQDAHGDHDFDEAVYFRAHNDDIPNDFPSDRQTNMNESSDHIPKKHAQEPVDSAFIYNDPPNTGGSIASEVPGTLNIVRSKHLTSAPIVEPPAGAYADDVTHKNAMITRPIDVREPSRSELVAIAPWSATSSHMSRELVQPPVSIFDDRIIARFAGDNELAPLAQYLAYVDQACALARGAGGAAAYDRSKLDARASEKIALDQLVQSRSTDILVQEIYRRHREFVAEGLFDS